MRLALNNLTCQAHGYPEYSRRYVVAAADCEAICEKLKSLKDDKVNFDKYVEERKAMSDTIVSVRTP